MTDEVYNCLSVCLDGKGTEDAVFTCADGWSQNGDEVLITTVSPLRSWRNWQTHQLEGLALARAWWFESTRPHTYSRNPANIGLFDDGRKLPHPAQAPGEP
jgi:hypothetical protein